MFIPDAPENGNDAGLAAIAVAPPKIEMWNARLGKVVASDKHAFGRLEVDTAPQLVPLPKRAQLVFVLAARDPAVKKQVSVGLDQLVEDRRPRDRGQGSGTHH